MEDNKTDRWFRQHLEEAEMKPPSASWAQMEAILDAQASENQDKKRPFAWYWAAAALVPLALVFWFMNKNTEPGKAGLAVENPAPERQVTPVIPSDKNGTLPAQKPEPRQQPEEQKRQVAIQQVPAKQARPAEEKLMGQQIVIALPIAEVSDSKPTAENETSVQPALAQRLNPDEEEEWVSIEFRSAKPEQTGEAHQLAIVEWRPGKPEKPKLAERLARLKKAGIQNLPSVDKAKSDLLAFLGFNK